MRKSLCIFFISMIGTLYSQSQWSDPVQVSGGVNPDIDIDPTTGTLHIVSLLDGVTYTKMDSLANILLQEAISNTGHDIGSWAYGATIAVDTNGTPHVAYRLYHDFPYFSNYYIKRLSNNWSIPLLLQPRTYRAYMIRMAIDQDNRIHIVHTEPTNEIQAKCVYQRILDGVINRTSSWDVSYRVDYRLEIDVCGNNYVHFVSGCPLYPHGPIIYHRSIDNGYTIDIVGDVHAEECYHRNGHSDLFADQAGNVHISYGSTLDDSINSNPSIWYVRYENGTITQNKRVTEEGWLIKWNNGQGPGLSSVASSDDGNVVAIAYATKDLGDLYVIISRDGGVTWSAPEFLATNVDARPDGRSRHTIRAYQNNFYVIYTETTNLDEPDQTQCSIMLRFLRNVSDEIVIQIAGNVTHYANQQPISNVVINWVEGENVADTTDLAGNFNISDLPSNTKVTLQPYKERYSDFTSSPIRSYDAALVARTAVGLMDSFSPEALAAADVDGDGEVTMHDAVHIARYAVGYTPPSHILVSEWKFFPDSLVYDPLTNSMSDQNFIGMLVGDVRIEWTNAKVLNREAQLSILPTIQTDDFISIPIGVDQCELLSLDMRCEYDVDDLEFVSGNISPEVEGFQLHYRENVEGILHLGLFGPDYYSGQGSILNLLFKLKSDEQKGTVSIRQIYINDNRSEDIEINLSENLGYENPSILILKQNIPNPFNDETTIHYDIHQEGKIRIDIVNSLGQNVVTLLDKNQSSGNHQIHWNGKDRYNQTVPTGIYFCRLQTADLVIVKKIAKIR